MGASMHCSLPLGLFRFNFSINVQRFRFCCTDSRSRSRSAWSWDEVHSATSVCAFSQFQRQRSILAGCKTWRQSQDHFRLVRIDQLKGSVQMYYLPDLHGHANIDVYVYTKTECADTKTKQRGYIQ